MLSVKFLITLATCCLVQAAQSYFETLSSGIDIQTRIIGAIEAKKGDFPYIVSVEARSSAASQYRHNCGGTIITRQWILTAGQCVIRMAPANIRIKAGKHQLNITEVGEQLKMVSAVFVHNNYTGGVRPYDIALIKLKTLLVFNKQIMPIALPKSSSSPSGNAVLSGWGSTSSNGLTMPVKLQRAVLPIIPLNTCRTALQNVTGTTPSLHESNVCTGPLTGGFAACTGDGGNPLVVTIANNKSEVVGLASWGIFPCGVKGAPTVYTRVSAHIEWIALTIAFN